jgi:hypothetical protein
MNIRRSNIINSRILWVDETLFLLEHHVTPGVMSITYVYRRVPCSFAENVGAYPYDGRRWKLEKRIELFPSE